MKGRGSPENTANRFESLTQSAELDCDFCGEEPLAPSSPKTLFFKDHSKSIIASNNSPDVGFTYSLNAYRGCEHGCIYCYARPTHEYLGMSSGLDFESKIFVKEKAPDLLRKELCSPGWTPATLVMSGVT